MTQNSLSQFILLLHRHGYDSALVQSSLGSSGLEAVALHNPEAAFLVLNSSLSHSQDHPHKDLGYLILSLVYLRRPATDAEFISLCGEEIFHALKKDSYIDRTSDGLYKLNIDIRPISVPQHEKEFLIASDADSSLEILPPQPDHVPGVGAAPLSLLRWVPHTVVDNQWDLGCGSGVLSLALPAHYRMGSDISQRALSFASASDSQQEVHWVEGSWFDPGKDKLWDRIISNPPFVIGPASQDHIYKNSGLEMDGITSLVLSQVGDYLAPSGMAHIMSSWALKEHETPGHKVSSVLPDEGIRAWVVIRDLVDPITYITTWLRDESIDPRSIEGQDKTRRWLQYFVDNEITQIAMGFVHIKKITGQTEILVEELLFPHDPDEFLGNEVEEYFHRADWLSRQDSSSLLQSRYQIRPTVALENISLPSTEDPGFKDHLIRITRMDGPRFSHEIDSDFMMILNGCHPQGLCLEDIVELFAYAHSYEDPQVLYDSIVPLIVDLIRHGFLIPEELL